MARGRNARKPEVRHLVGFQLLRQPLEGHAVSMSERPIEDVLRELTEAIASDPIDVADFGPTPVPLDWSLPHRYPVELITPEKQTASVRVQASRTVRVVRGKVTTP